ncbi:GerAB/ArcD/ProY family transporter [Desnuesiella massiliensis]|uniref:GerAB/ArcD/ProY family transporter n=1 Tax=Desnuesiella massiliensis TaxID=1650662 RepID=UPI0006E2C315|nr:GerAB/ArcD/ProY family transporter [Desnuesiella massiliensis]
MSNRDYTLTVFGIIVGIGVLSLPNEIAKIAYEDAWISVILGGIYPLYMVFIAKAMVKSFPEENIILISKKYLGKYLGSLLNIIFFSYFIFTSSMVLSGYINLIRTFALGFLTPIKVIGIMAIMIAYASSKGVKTLSKINVYIFCVALLIFMSPYPALRQGSIKNVMPIFHSGVKNILKGGLTTTFAYAGIECIFILYPSIENKAKFLSASLKGLLIVVLLYAWVVFITIYYLGADIISKTYWSFLSVTESVTITIVNNFRYIFMFLWSLVAFKVVANSYYTGMVILNDFFKGWNVKRLSYMAAPIMVILPLLYGNMVKRNYILNKGIKIYLIFNILYVTIIYLVMVIKKDEKSD